MLRMLRQKLLNPVLSQLSLMENKIDKLSDTTNSMLNFQQPSPGEITEQVLLEFNHLLHELRSNEIAHMPKDIKVLLSAGASDRSYFDWIEREFGKVDKHIGIELYRPKPDDLPPYVEWISDNVGEMKGVPDKSVDMVFSGQNIEHLQFDDLVGFIHESHRVLKKGGWLVIDSVNRIITSHVKWMHPEHIAEFTVEEMDEMLLSGGFETKHRKGLLLMRESDGSPIWSLHPNLFESAYAWGGNDGWLRRSINAHDKPNDSFIWWIEARKQADTVDKEQLRNVCERIFTNARQEMIERTQNKDRNS